MAGIFLKLPAGNQKEENNHQIWRSINKPRIPVEKINMGNEGHTQVRKKCDRSSSLLLINTCMTEFD
ncbi:hypothetical protein [Brunnivagina elsteri]|uniref:Uncharacterized protein n=1 Tax=Brunnivagina elsteri CCALA 953 TaxID=987040 RepID=A0A2A2TFE0_9CYAN|nr:hypothetical protein [Calothrix elsteri]PAX52452.1 hypothetical protein CK510_19245 [Calothrix elsteri CCALA 953]